MYQFTPLHSAANGGHVKTIQKLIHFSHDVDVKDYLGAPPSVSSCHFLICPSLLVLSRHSGTASTKLSRF